MQASSERGIFPPPLYAQGLYDLCFEGTPLVDVKGGSLAVLLLLTQVECICSPVPRILLAGFQSNIASILSSHPIAQAITHSLKISVNVFFLAFSFFFD